MRCPSCGGTLVELDRGGVRVDACRDCRGVWLDRGELDKIVERERKVVAGVDDDEQDFVREMTGHGKQPERQYGLDPKAAQRMYDDYRHTRKHKKRKSFLDDLFD
jgi:Zn-finger nucleic acid-binding protein